MLNRTLIALSLLTIQLNAESIDMDNQSYPPQELTQMKRNDVVSLNASLVLYKLLHDGTTYLVTNNDVANIPDRTIKQGKEKCVGAEYKPGFNVGFRIQPQNDEFDYRASWTYYRSSVSSKTTTDGSNFVIEPTWLVPSLADSPTFNNGDVGGTLVLINSLKADVSNITHWIDGDVGRYFRPLGTVWIGIRPHAGFRWFMTRDQLNLATQRSAVGGNINFEPFNDRSYLKNNYWERKQNGDINAYLNSKFMQMQLRHSFLEKVIQRVFMKLLKSTRLIQVPLNSSRLINTIMDA